MTDLEPEDSGRYWCAVEINGVPDVWTEQFQLSVSAVKIPATLPYDYMTGVLVSFTALGCPAALVSVPLCSGTPELYVDQQEVTGVGGSVIVKCYCSYTGNRKSWCRIGGSVSCVERNSGALDGTSVTLHQTTDATRGNILMVTMSGLKMENTGWYRCRVGDLVMPVHITVRRQTTTQSTTTMTTTKAPTTEQSSFSPTAEPVQTDNTVQGPEPVETDNTVQGPEPVQTDNTVQGPEGGKEKDTMRKLSLIQLYFTLTLSNG
nr:uncharacterized protein LOC111961919 [Salvelinus alpinus]